MTAIRLKLKGLWIVLSIYLRHRKQLVSKHGLPPGRLIRLYDQEMLNRRLVLELADKYGPVFKARRGNGITICILGMKRCHQFIKENSSNMRLSTMDLTSLFPHGFIRAMEGKTHSHYRNALIKGLAPDLMDQNRTIHETLIQQTLEDYRTQQASDDTSAEAYIQTLKTIGAGLLVQTFFGVNPGSKNYDYLIGKYLELATPTFAWEVKERQQTIFVNIRDFLLEKLETGIELSPHSILAELQKTGGVDETMLGNLIYMVEMGRHDMAGLFRWLSKYASEQPDAMQAIAGESIDFSSESMTHARAFVYETLRMDQIERLGRIMNQDVVFEGFGIPKGASVRLCLWESHKDPDVFPEPFTFNLNRFFDKNYSLKEYAPFGIDHHRCPLGQVAIRMSMMVLKTLADNYTIQPIGDGPAHRSPFHWQPAQSFTVRLEPT